MSEKVLSLFYCWDDIACDGRKCPNNDEFWNPNEGSNVTECKERNRHYREAWDCKKKLEKVGVLYYTHHKIRLTNEQMALVREAVQSAFCTKADEVKE
jgi:hypothetical protein